MSLNDLYQELIIDHSKRPRNYGSLEDATHCCDGHNPLCGDAVTVYIKVEDGVVVEAKFEGNGCAISTASASMLTEAVRGKTVAEVEALFESFRRALTDSGADPGPEVDLGSLESLRGVKEYPMRVKCATLPWHTLHAALIRQSEPTSTE